MILEAGSNIQIKREGYEERVGRITKVEGNLIWYKTNIQGLIADMNFILDDKVQVEFVPLLCDDCLKRITRLYMHDFDMLCDTCSRKRDDNVQSCIE